MGELGSKVHRAAVQKPAAGRQGEAAGGEIRHAQASKALEDDNWVDLREYTPMDTVRQQLMLYSHQYNLYMKTVVSLQNNLISLTDKTFPGVSELFSSPERTDGHQKWVDSLNDIRLLLTPEVLHRCSNRTASTRVCH